jgi:hypothetical protein
LPEAFFGGQRLALTAQRIAQLLQPQSLQLPVPNFLGDLHAFAAIAFYHGVVGLVTRHHREVVQRGRFPAAVTLFAPKY